VATLGSFTQAAEALYISQPAVTKHIHELESQWGLSLFERKGNSIRLTEAGQIALQYTGRILETYRDLEFDLSALKQQLAGRLRLGASTTNAQYVLPAALAQFNERFPDVAVSLITENSKIIETALLEKEIDLGLVENHSRNKALKYVPFLQDELVLVTATRHGLYRQVPITLTELTNMPLVLREKGSGTLEVLEKFLKGNKLGLRDLEIRLYLGSSEGIKAYLLESKCCSIVSVRTVAKEVASGQLRVLPIADSRLERQLSFVHLQGQASPLPTMFMHFIGKYLPSH
jgi:DNA-binding transcriptional LysR family regulator